VAESTRAPVVLVRYGEVGLKGDNRAWFEQRLADNLRRAAAHLGPYRIRNLRGRLVLAADHVPTEKGDPWAVAEQAAGVAARVFGVVGAVPALEVPAELAAIEDAAVTLVDRHLPSEGDPALTFKVAARRSNKAFALDSMQLNHHLGAHLLRRFGSRLRVDVHRPELTLHVEVRDRVAFVYGDERPGPGGQCR